MSTSVSVSPYCSSAWLFSNRPTKKRKAGLLCLASSTSKKQADFDQTGKTTQMLIDR